jgi:hypothetical protein
VRADAVTPPRQAESPALEDKAFLVLLVVVTLAFAWILWPFFGAVLWGVILAIVFAPSRFVPPVSSSGHTASLFARPQAET